MIKDKYELLMKGTKNVIYLLMSLFLCISCQNNTPHYSSYDDYPIYEGNDLGLTYSPQLSQCKIWAPTASEAILRIYDSGVGGKSILKQNMQKDIQGTWKVVIDGDWKNKFYTVQVLINNTWMNEVPDPYAKAVGVNGKRAAIIDLTETDLEHWQEDKKPDLKSFTDIILYELHIRDVSIAPNSGIKQKRKFLGLTETGAILQSGKSTGIDHIKELGVTHVHLLPCFDFSSIDESKSDSAQYNWGYDPQNYNVPEGSYSSDPYNPEIRIKEFKQMVQTLHQNGLRVVMDVVYNHTSATQESVFNQLVPGYFYRHNSESSFSNASGCGNEIASERPMVRKFIVESVKYWATEYHVDGFRFDLMGVHDIETMKQIRSELDHIDSTIFIYGEGWTAGNSPYPAEERALKSNMKNLDRIAAFCDDLRDGIKGSWSDEKDKGFVSGKSNMEESIKFGVVAASQHPQINYALVNYSKAPWANEPTQCINYTSCHDDLTLWDKLLVSAPEEDEQTRIKMYNLSNAIVLTSQGIPFLHAGVEMARTKSSDHNSYRSPDSINQIDWERKGNYKNVFEYYKNMIALRKQHPAFRMNSTEMIHAHLEFISVFNKERGNEEKNVVAFILKENANGDSWKDILVIYNANKTPVKINVPNNKWTIVVEGDKINMEGVRKSGTNLIEVAGISMLVAYSN